MELRGFGVRRGVILGFSLCSIGVALLPATAAAQAEFVVTPVAERTVAELPAGPLYWQVETFPALADAEAAAGPLSLTAEVEGKAWLFTLGAKGAPAHGGSVVAEIGPLVDVSAPEYLLRVNTGVAPPGAKTAVHTHPGTEAFFVLEGQLSQKNSARRECRRCRRDAGGGRPRGPDGGHQQRHRGAARADHVRR